MKKFKYQISSKDYPTRETWVCEVCRKANSDLVLIGKWKLIDRCMDANISCDLCGYGIAVNGVNDNLSPCAFD